MKFFLGREKMEIAKNFHNAPILQVSINENAFVIRIAAVHFASKLMAVLLSLYGMVYTE